jgi:hypothetical protein
MAGEPANETLFHLVPLNERARDALGHPDNRRFISDAAGNCDGLEIGYHVPQIAGGHVITRLGRNTDLVLPKAGSKVHVAFEINPETRLILLSVRSKYPSTVTVALAGKAETEPIPGDCVIVYGQNYVAQISSYQFELIWRFSVKSAKKLAWRGYEESKLKLTHIRSRDLSEEQPADYSWYHTRLQSAKDPVLREVREARVPIGNGAFGQVYKTADGTTANPFAVKVVDLKKHLLKEDVVRAALHREVKILEKLSHVSC